MTAQQTNCIGGYWIGDEFVLYTPRHLSDPSLNKRAYQQIDRLLTPCAQYRVWRCATDSGDEPVIAEYPLRPLANTVQKYLDEYQDGARMHTLYIVTTNRKEAIDTFLAVVQLMR